MCKKSVSLSDVVSKPEYAGEAGTRKVDQKL